MCQMPNIWHIWHTKHKNFIRCFKSKKLCHIATVLSQIWDGTDNSGKMGYYYFIAFFSLLFHRYLSLRRLYLISSLSVTLYLFPLLLAQESCLRSLSRKISSLSPPHLPILTANLASPHRWSRHPMLWFWLIWWVLGLWLGFDLGWGCG